jgi:peptidoglycan hydrolase FlgJ
MNALSLPTILLETGPNASGSAPAANRQATLRAGREFEAMFLGQMFSHMFTDLGANGMFGGGHAEEVYQSMLHQELGGVIAKRGGIGLADAITRQMIRLQEANRP